MIQKIENVLSISVKEKSPTGKVTPVDLTRATHILFTIKQRFGQYLEFNADFVEDSLVVKIPYEDAMKLSTSPAEVQLLWTDKDGNKQATKPKLVEVDKLLREAGYD